MTCNPHWSNFGFAPKQADAIMAAIEGTEAKPSMWGFEKSKQLRTELGRRTLYWESGQLSRRCKKGHVQRMG